MTKPFSHDFYDREDGIAHCKVCNGAEGSLPTLCPRRKMTAQEERAVHAGRLDFNAGGLRGGSKKAAYVDRAGWWVPVDGIDAPPADPGDPYLRRLIALTPRYSDDTNYAHGLRIARAVLEDAQLRRLIALTPDFEAVRDKRMSDLTPAQRFNRKSYAAMLAAAPQPPAAAAPASIADLIAKHGLESVYKAAADVLCPKDQHATGSPE